MSSEHDAQHNHPDKTSEKNSPKEGVTDSAHIKSTDDNKRHAQVEIQQAVRSFRITGVDEKTGRKQEPFMLVDGSNVHHDVREEKLAKEPMKGSDSLPQIDAQKEQGRQITNNELVDVGWKMVDMKNDPPKANQLLQELDDDKYNCKYYLKTYIEGHLPNDKHPSDCEIKNGYMEEHGFHKEKLHSSSDLKDGDVVMIKAPDDGHIHMSPIIHVAIVMHDKDGKLVLIQKPDDIHHVQKCSWKDFRDHFRKAVPNLDIPGPDIDVYRR